jgi:hypothetical protein
MKNKKATPEKSSPKYLTPNNNTKSSNKPVSIIRCDDGHEYMYRVTLEHVTQQIVEVKATDVHDAVVKALRGYGTSVSHKRLLPKTKPPVKLG